MNEHSDREFESADADERPETETGDGVRDDGIEAATGDGEAAAEENRSDEPADVDEELGRMREAMLRMQAEMANREKRLERETDKARKFALERLLRDLIPVLDSMDQALASTEGQDGTAREGMELTRRQALQMLQSHGLEVLDPAGETFDPTWHEAMSTQPTEEQAPDTVVHVLQKGYRLHDRLIRPARVIVAKAP